MSLFRRTTLPPAARGGVQVSTGDRILADAELRDNHWAVATRKYLVITDTSGETHLNRPWSDVDRASYDPEATTLTVRWVDGESPTILRLAEPRRTALVQTVRERVQSSVILAESVPLGDGRSVRVAVRRGEDGGLFSQVVADDGVDLADPDVAECVDVAETRVRSASGLPL